MWCSLWQCALQAVGHHHKPAQTAVHILLQTAAADRGPEICKDTAQIFLHPAGLILPECLVASGSFRHCNQLLDLQQIQVADLSIAMHLALKRHSGRQPAQPRGPKLS